MAGEGRSAGRGRKRQAEPGSEWLKRREGSSDWHYDFTIDGHRLRGSCGTGDQVLAARFAKRQYDEAFASIRLGQAPIVHLTLPEAAARYYDEVARGTRYGEQAVRHQLATMIEVMGERRRLVDITDATVNELVQALRRRRIVPHGVDPANDPNFNSRKTFSPATINRYLTTLSAMCRRARDIWGVEVGKWDLGQHKQTEPGGREVFLDHTQARALVAAAVPHAQPILLLALTTGMRKANVHDLAWEQVSLDLGWIYTRQKGARKLLVRLPPPALSLLARLEPDVAKRQGPVFRFGNPAWPCDCAACLSPAKKGKAITSTRRAFATAAKAAGLRDMPAGRLRFHDMRHTTASWLLAEGGDLRLVQEHLGHANITTTARYSHMVAGRQASVVAAATEDLWNEPAAPAETGKKRA